MIWLDKNHKVQNGCSVSSVYGSKASHWYKPTKLPHHTDTGKTTDQL